MPSRTKWTELSIALLALSACGEQGERGAAQIPTYHADVAPILAQQCNGCHRPGGIAPFALVDYEDARRVADAIRISTAARTMPPFSLDNSGDCNTYVEGRWLTDEQIETLGAWARGGAPEGELPAEGPPETKPEIRLDRVDLTVAMQDPYTPDAKLFDDYRCFIVDPGLSIDRFIVGFDVRPLYAQMVHHLTLFSIDTQKGEEKAEALDAAEPGPGYSCIDDIHVDDTRWLVGWGPGGSALRLPEGTGLRMHAGRKAILQIHYNQVNGRFPDRTEIDLELEDAVPHEAWVRRLADTGLFLPPREASVSETQEQLVPSPITLHGLWPHMHQLGKSMLVTSARGEEKTCLARVNHWDFHWQGFAHYTTPITLEAGDRMSITCTYDTRSRDTATTWGQGTNDEMCIAFFLMTQPDP